VLGDDDEDASRRATVLVPDVRAHHYWVATDTIAREFQKALPLVDEAAWDVYLLYASGVEWGDEGPPPPTYYMHQLVGRLPAGRLLNGETLAAETRAQLAALR